MHLLVLFSLLLHLCFSNTMETENIPKVTAFIQKYMPHATLEEQIEATENLRVYLRVHYRIFLRRESEGEFDTAKEDRTEAV